MRSRPCLALAALALVAGMACAGRVEPVLDLTPWTWTWSQAVLEGWVIRYAHPKPLANVTAASAATALAGDPVADAMPRSAALASEPATGVSSGRATRFATFHYDCAREDRSEDAPCSVFLDLWLLALEPPLAAATLPAFQEHFDLSYPIPAPQLDGMIRDARDREWLHRAQTWASGAAFSHYSRPLSARLAIAVTSYTTRAPDRLVARDLARDAIDRIRIEAAAPLSR